MFRLAASPHLMPGRSLRGSTVGPLVDLGILPTGGCVYLTRTELWEATRLMPDVATGIAAELGWVSPDQVKELADRLAVLGQELEAALAQQTRVVTIDEVLAEMNPAAA